MTYPNRDETRFRCYRKVLTIAGSDSGGGAGIQADLKTFMALGCYGLTAVTALTAQNTMGVNGIHPIPPDFVAAQMEAIFRDMGADAVKIGMLYSAESTAAVAAELCRHQARRIVLDPVMISQSGQRLLQEDAVAALKTRLIPLADLITPNLPEAAVLLGRRPDQLGDAATAARDLSRLGAKAVLLKAGHMEDASACNDLLYLAASDRFVELEAERIVTPNNHGTGCVLSAAVAAGLALGLDMEAAVRQAKSYLHAALAAGTGYRLGRGHGPVFFGVATPRASAETAPRVEGGSGRTTRISVLER